MTNRKEVKKMTAPKEEGKAYLCLCCGNIILTKTGHCSYCGKTSLQALDKGCKDVGGSCG